MIKVWNPDIKDPVLSETAWERQMQIAGALAYERSREGRDAGETVAGQQLMRKLIKRASDAIATMQKDILGVNRVSRELKATVLLVPAETSSLVTLRVLLNRTYMPDDFEHGANFQELCVRVAKAIELELNFINWLNQSKLAAKEYAETNGLKTTPRSYAERLLEEHGMDNRSIRRWKKSFEELRRYSWDSLSQHYCGEALVQTVVESLPEVFEFSTEYSKGKKVKFVRLTDKARKTFDTAESRIAHMQVVRKPMLTAPKPWTKEVH